jgi:hypothetical protein
LLIVGLNDIVVLNFCNCNVRHVCAVVASFLQTPATHHPNNQKGKE